MSYPPGHRQKTREQIVRSARTLFNRHGFDGTSIDQIMASAGLTRGVFYSYFSRKADLYAEAIGLALKEPPSTRWKSVSVDFAAVDAARQVIRAYLSQEHLDDVDGSCPLVALPNDVSRSNATVKRVFESVFKAMVELFQQGLATDARDVRSRALAIAGICVGGMVVARSLQDRQLAVALRESAMRVALELGHWPDKRKAGSSRRRARGVGGAN